MHTKTSKIRKISCKFSIFFCASKVLTAAYMLYYKYHKCVKSRVFLEALPSVADYVSVWFCVDSIKILLGIYSRIFHSKIHSHIFAYFWLLNMLYIGNGKICLSSFQKKTLGNKPFFCYFILLALSSKLFLSRIFSPFFFS